MVKVGIAGCGSVTKYRHAPEYAENPSSVIIGFYDPAVTRSEALAAAYGGKVYTSYEEMLRDDIDAVSVCSANAFHAKMTIDALKAGKHVLCEKPMATSIPDAEEMIRTAEKHHKFLMIGHNQRLNPVHIKAKEILKSGELGRVITFKTSFAHKGPELWSADKGKNTWFFNKASAFVGAMGDLGIHKADLIRWLIESEIAEVAAVVTTLDKKDAEGNFISVDDNAICILKSTNGIIGTISTSWTCYGAEENSTVLYCSKGIMKIFDDPKYSISIIKSNGDTEHYCVGQIQTNENQTKSGVIDLFISSILNNTAPEISGYEGLAALKIIMACLESSEKRSTVYIK